MGAAEHDPHLTEHQLHPEKADVPFMRQETPLHQPLDFDLCVEDDMVDKAEEGRGGVDEPVVVCGCEGVGCGDGDGEGDEKMRGRVEEGGEFGANGS